MESVLFQLLFYWGVIVVIALVVVIIALVAVIKGITQNYIESMEEKDRMRERHNREIRQIRDEEKGFTDK